MIDPRDVQFVTLDGFVSLLADWTDLNRGDGSLVSCGARGWWYGNRRGDGGVEPGSRLGFYDWTGWHGKF